MASYVENFASKLDWAMPFQRTGKFPIDRTTLFSSYDDAVKYAAGDTGDPDSRGLCGTSYVGQIITVYENSVVTVYKIDENRTLSEIGSGSAIVEVDDKSIGKNGALLEIKGFNTATENQTIRKKADGNLEWYTPSVSDIPDLTEALANKADKATTLAGYGITDAYTKTEVDQKVSGAFHYKGSVADMEALEGIQSPSQGDVYQVTSESKMYVWDGDSWEEFGAGIDLSGYVEKTEFNPIKGTVDSLPSELSQVMDVSRTDTTNTLEIRIFTKQEDGTYSPSEKHGVVTLVGAGQGPDDKSAAGLMTKVDKEKLDAIEAGAQANKIESVTLVDGALTITAKGVTIPRADANNYGVVKSSADNGKVSVETDGSMSVNSMNATKLYLDAGDVLVLSGGTADPNGAVE